MFNSLRDGLGQITGFLFPLRIMVLFGKDFTKYIKGGMTS